MKKFKIPVSWSAAADLIIEAKDLESAISDAKESELPEDWEYIDGSYKVDAHLIDEFPENYGEIKEDIC